MLVRPYSSKLLRFFAGAVFAITPLALTAQAPSGATRWADSVRITLDRAVGRGNATEIAAARGIAERALLAFPDDAMLLHLQGTALWREAQLVRARNTRESASSADAMLERAIGILQRSDAARPMAETKVVIASAYGTLAGGGMRAAMRNGPRANAAEDEAKEMAPNNPRVLLVSGISAFYKPAAFGGGKDKARAAITRAIAAFPNDRPAAPMPAWGHAEAYAWLGQIEADAGNTAAARRAYQRALELEPEYNWVRLVLLPALDRPR
jgi:tetratricopeptide (TPR) repeat protein